MTAEASVSAAARPHVGRAVARSEDFRLLTGDGRFVADYADDS